MTNRPMMLELIWPFGPRRTEMRRWPSRMSWWCWALLCAKSFEPPEKRHHELRSSLPTSTLVLLAPLRCPRDSPP